MNFLLQEKKVVFFQCDAGSRSAVSSSCCDSQVERSGAASELDRFSRFFKLAISFNECFNFNERLEDHLFISHVTPPSHGPSPSCNVKPVGSTVDGLKSAD